jgi:uncharacterized membrane protein
MKEKKSKYDTNPLPDDVLRQAEEAFGQTNVLPDPTQTEPFAPKLTPLPNPNSEMPTRPFQEKYAEPYQSVFDTNFQQTPMSQPIATGRQTKPERYKPEKLPLTSRSVEGLGLPENVVMVAPYVPLTLGAIAALIILLLTPRLETRVRFHASQGLALHIASFAISTILGIIGGIVDNNISGVLFGIASTIFFIVSMIRVWQGEPHHIEPLDDATNWLNEKIITKR